MLYGRNSLLCYNTIMLMLQSEYTCVVMNLVVPDSHVTVCIWNTMTSLTKTQAGRAAWHHMSIIIFIVIAIGVDVEQQEARRESSRQERHVGSNEEEKESFCNLPGEAEQLSKI